MIPAQGNQGQVVQEGKHARRYIYLDADANRYGWECYYHDEGAIA